MVFTKSVFHCLDLTNNVLNSRHPRTTNQDNCVTRFRVGMHAMPRVVFDFKEVLSARAGICK